MAARLPFNLMSLGVACSSQQFSHTHTPAGEKQGPEKNTTQSECELSEDKTAGFGVTGLLMTRRRSDWRTTWGRV